MVSRILFAWVQGYVCVCGESLWHSSLLPVLPVQGGSGLQCKEVEVSNTEMHCG